MKNLIEIIQEYSLTVRCLPHVVEENWTYVDGQQLKDGEELIQYKPNIEYFQEKYGDSAQNMMNRFYEKFPNGRLFVNHKKKVENGGWWYVKECANTNSIVTFNRKVDKFFAPTLEEAIKLFLKSKNIAF